MSTSQKLQSYPKYKAGTCILYKDPLVGVAVPIILINYEFELNQWYCLFLDDCFPGWAYEYEFISVISEPPNSL